MLQPFFRAPDLKGALTRWHLPRSSSADPRCPLRGDLRAACCRAAAARARHLPRRSSRLRALRCRWASAPWRRSWALAPPRRTPTTRKRCAAQRGAARGGLCFERGSSTGATWQRGEERPRRGASARGRDARHIARMGPYDGGSARWCACGRPRMAPGTPSPWPWVQSAGVSWRAAAPPVAGSRARVVVSGTDSESGCTLNAAGQPREPRDPETGAPERCQQQGREEEEC